MLLGYSLHLGCTKRIIFCDAISSDLLSLSFVLNISLYRRIYKVFIALEKILDEILPKKLVTLVFPMCFIQLVNPTQKHFLASS